MDTEQALVAAALANWSERDVKLRLADYWQEQGKPERATLTLAAVDTQWETEPDRSADGRHRHLLRNGDRVLGAVFPTSDPDKLLLIAECPDTFYMSSATEHEDGRRKLERFLLSGQGDFTGFNKGLITNTQNEH